MLYTPELIGGRDRNKQSQLVFCVLLRLPFIDQKFPSAVFVSFERIVLIEVCGTVSVKKLNHVCLSMQLIKYFTSLKNIEASSCQTE